MGKYVGKILHLSSLPSTALECFSTAVRTIHTCRFNTLLVCNPLRSVFFHVVSLVHPWNALLPCNDLPQIRRLAVNLTGPGEFANRRKYFILNSFFLMAEIEPARKHPIPWSGGRSQRRFKRRIAAQSSNIIRTKSVISIETRQARKIY